MSEVTWAALADVVRKWAAPQGSHSAGSLADAFAERGNAQTEPANLNDPQPPPARVSGPAVWDLVMQDMRERDEHGRRKYDVRLTPGDGRDSLVDAYQEALDLVVYLRKAIAERDGR